MSREQDIVIKELTYDTDLFYESERKLKNNVSERIKYVVIGLAVVIPVVIFTFAPSRYLGEAIFAYINCLLYAVFAVHFIKKGSLCSLIPLISPLYMIIGSCVGIIYFSIFYPDGVYWTMVGEVSYFAGGVRYQLAIFLFLLVYFVLMNLFLRKEEVIPQHPSMVSRYVGYLSMVFFVPISCFHMLTLIISLPDYIAEWGYRLYNYYQTLFFAAGVVYVRLSRAVKMALMFFLTFVLVFYSLGSSRGLALLPITALASGLFFFSEAKSRTKIILFVSGIVALPWFLLISNTTRVLLGLGEGRYEELSYKWATLKEWRYVAKQVPVGANFFGRMFFTAGHVIVAYSPNQYPYRHFSPAGFAKEAAVSMLPFPVQKFTGIILDAKKAQYTGPWILLDYGIYISEGTSTEVSTIGNLWMFGGYIPVAIGGFLLALIHSFIAWIVRRAWTQNPDKGIFYFAVFYFIIFWSLNWDIIHIWRSTILQFVFAYVGFKLISPFLKIGYANIAGKYE